MNKIIGYLILAVFLAGFGGYALFDRVQSSPADSNTNVITLRIYPGPGPAAALFALAEHRGYFAEEGLKIELKKYDTGPQTLLALQADQLDVAQPAEFVFVRNSFDDKSSNLRIIGSLSRWAGIELIARKDKGITGISDLAGKKIGLPMGTQAEFALADYLIQKGVPSDTVQLIDIPSREDGVTAITSSAVDAIVAINEFAYRSKKELGDTALSWWLQEEIPSFPLLITTQAKLEQNPASYEKLLRALTRAVTYANDHPAAVKEIAITQLGYPPDFIEYYWDRISFDVGLPQELLMVMEHQARWLVGKQLVRAQKAPNYLPYIRTDLLEHISPETVTIIK